MIKGSEVEESERNFGGSRNSYKDFNTLQAAENENPKGIWSIMKPCGYRTAKTTRFTPTKCQTRAAIPTKISTFCKMQETPTPPEFCPTALPCGRPTQARTRFTLTLCRMYPTLFKLDLTGQIPSNSPKYTNFEIPLNPGLTSALLGIRFLFLMLPQTSRFRRRLFTLNLPW